MTKPKRVDEPVYSREEILSNAGAFGVRAEIVAGALRLTKKDRLTRAEVLDLIQQFKERAV